MNTLKMKMLVILITMIAMTSVWSADVAVMGEPMALTADVAVMGEPMALTADVAVLGSKTRWRGSGIVSQV